MHRTPSRTLGLLTALNLSACADTLSFVDRNETDVWQQAPTDQVDILWVVDNSNSMQVEQELLVAGFDSFIEEIERTEADFHLGVITTDLPYDNPDRAHLIGDPPVITKDMDYVEMFKSRAVVGLNGSGKEKGLGAAAYALDPVLTTSGGYNTGFLRDEANLLVIFVSDEDDCSDDNRLGLDADNRDCYQKRNLLVPVEDYVTKFQGIKGRKDQVQLAAIVGPEESDASALCRDTTLPGSRYMDAARLTGGLAASICETDWSDVLYELGLNAAGIFTVFELSHGAKPDTLEVTVNGEPVPESDVDGYTYDDVAFTIEFHGIWVPERGAEITASYTVEPGT